MPRRRGRPSKDSSRTHVYLENDIMGELEIFILDPVKGKLRYSALSSIINNLLRQFVRELRKPGVDPLPILAAYGVELEREKTKTKGDDDDDLE